MAGFSSLRAWERTFPAVRYHSLVVENDKNDFHVCAVSESDGEIMAIENTDLKLFGLQFHPESYATDQRHNIHRKFCGGLQWKYLKRSKQGMDLTFEEATIMFNEMLSGNVEEASY